MEPKKLSIQRPDDTPEATKRSDQTPRKSAAFSAHLLAYLCWEGNGSPASAQEYRPIFAVFAATEAGMNPFIANLRLGHPAVRDGGLRSFAVKFKAAERLLYTRETLSSPLEDRHADMPRSTLALTTIEVPDLFAQDTGMVDPLGIGFVCLCPDWWIRTAPGLSAAECRTTLGTIEDECRPLSTPFHLRLRWVARSMLSLTDLELVEWSKVATRVAIFFDRRSERPVLPDPRFHLRLLANGFAAKTFAVPADSRPSGFESVLAWNQGFSTFYGDGLSNIGVRYALAVKLTHVDADLLLSEAVKLHRAALGA